MSQNLRDLLHQLADHESAGAAATAPDPRTEVRHVMTDIRTRRTRRTALVGAAAVTVLAVGVATATALTPAPRDPATDPRPTPTPTPSATPAPAPTASPTATASPPVRWGVVDSLAVAPTPGWTLTPDAVRPDGAPATFVDIATGAPYGAVGFVRAGDVLVTSVTTDEGGSLAGVDAGTGDVLWVEDTDVNGRPSGVCGGVTSAGLVACRATPYGDTSAVVLVDPADGSVVRTLPLPFTVDSFGVDGGTVVAHGTTDATTARWDGLDAATGATLWSHVEPGASSDEEVMGDLFALTRVAEPYAHLYSYGYQVAVDTRTGERAPRGAPDLGASVWAPGDGVGVPAFERDDASGADGETRYRLRAVDPATGAELWTVESDGVRLAGVVGDGVLLLEGDSLVHRDLATGAERWRTGGVEVLATDGERILLTPTAGTDLTALSLADGSVSWTVPGTRGNGLGSWVDRGRLVVGIDEVARMFAW